MTKTIDQIHARLKSLGNHEDAAGKARFGIKVEQAYGIRIPQLRKLAKELGRDHDLALALWETGMHEARILASMIDDPKQVSEAQMEAWVRDFNSWDLCDQVCGNLFDRTPLAYAKAHEWAAREPDFEKRAGFALMAWLAVHDKKAPDEQFSAFLPVIEREAGDERNFVRKAVNWALRQIGKRNAELNAEAIATAKRLAQLDSKAAQWNAADALKELASEKVQARLNAI
jgi:3-methyladenine DNA glycosylase AlkD